MRIMNLGYTTVYTSVLAVVGILLLICTGTSSGIQTDWTKEDYPNPKVNISTCGNSDVSFICDPNRATTQLQAEKLNGSVVDVYDTGNIQAFPCGCNHNHTCSVNRTIIGIAFVGRVASRTGSRYPGNKLERREYLQAFADYLRATSWKFGGACGNDVVIVIGKNIRRMRTSVGTTAGKVLTQACLNQVEERTRQLLEDSQFYTAADAMIASYRQILGGDTSGCHNVLAWAVPLGVIGGLVLILAVTLLSCHFCCPERLRRCGRHMRNTPGGGAFPWMYGHRSRRCGQGCAAASNVDADSRKTAERFY